MHTAEKVFDRWREKQNYLGSNHGRKVSHSQVLTQCHTPDGHPENSALSERRLSVTGVDGFVDSFTEKEKDGFFSLLVKKLVIELADVAFFSLDDG